MDELDSAEIAKLRLRDGLKEAMRAKEMLRVRVLRALVAAIDDAQAPPAEHRHDRYVVHAFEDRTAEVPRLSLTAADLAALFEAEAASRRAAAEAFAGLGRVEEAETLLAEAVVIDAWAAA